MGRKIDMKKIEDITKCQVTFSKPRSSVMKKANEIALCCDVDVAFIAFSPSGRVSKFCNQTRIEDVIERYANLPAENRLNHISNFQEKMEKLRQVGHIKGDTNKIHYLDNQIENLELQIKKSELELQILETGLRDYEPGSDQDPSLHQLCWCERNLNNSLQRVLAKKDVNQKELESQAKIQLSSNCLRENEQALGMKKIMMQLDPWISPYGARVRESILQDLADEANYTTNENLGLLNVPSFSISSNLCSLPSLQIPLETTFSDATRMSTQSLCNIEGPRFTSTTSVATMPNIMNNNGMVYTNSNLSQLNNIMEGQEIGKINMDCISMDTSDESQAPDHHKETFQDTLFDDLLPEDIVEDDIFWTSKVRKTHLWEWEDLLLDENFNL